MSAPGLTIVGLDSATLDVVEPLAGAGELPNLARLLESGSYGTLRSTVHPLTPQAWTTMVTGVNAGRHGIWDFLERAGSGYELEILNGSYRTAPAVWDHLAEHGRRVGLVNVPFTWPAPPVDGFVLSGFDTAAHHDMTSPRELLEDIERRHGRLLLDHKFPIAPDGRIDLELVRAACRQKVDVALDLFERYEPDLLFVVFMSADHVQHLAWSEWERDGSASDVAEVYRILDEALGRLVDPLSERDVLVVSDHGAGRLEGVVNLNAWLEREGFLAYKTTPGAAPHRLARRALELRRRVLPERARRAIKRAAPELSARAVRSSAADLVDMSRTRAFAYGAFGNIVLNVAGREEQGIVDPGPEYLAVRDEIAARLLALRDPDGRAIVRAVHPREDLYDGPALARAPDLIVEFIDYAWLGKGNLRRRTPTIWDEVEIESGSAYSYVGSHRLEGLVALAGPSARTGAHLDARIEDVAPTVLYLLGQAVPGSMEGRVLVEALDPALVAARPVAFADSHTDAEPQLATYSRDEAVEVEERLRNLGYLD